MGGSSKKQTVGYKYYLGLHMVMCHGPVDSVRRIEVDNKTAWEGEATGGPVSFNKPNLFGGEEREGGVSGTIDIDMGEPTQGQNGYLRDRLGADVPSYRGVLSAVFRQVYVGNNPYIKRWLFWATRIHKTREGLPQWYDSKAQIGQDMNPAHIIRECLTDPDWGMGYLASDVDEASFQLAADTLYDEGMGMSLLWDRSVELDEFIQQVLNHIDGALYVHRNTGKFTLKLARGGYDVDTLLVLDESSVQKISNFKRNTVAELTNSVTVVYWDGQTGKNNSVTVQDIALTAAQGTTIGTTLQYPGFTKGEIASRVAARDLRALSTPLASAEIYANRKAASLNIGDVFVLSWPRYGVSQMVMRVSNIELGSLESNIVKISAIEDVFALSEAIYAPPPPSEWNDPNNPPAPVPYHSTEEATYWELVQRVGETEAQGLDPLSGFAVTTGVRPSPDATRCVLYSNYSGTYEEAGPVEFCPTALLDADITEGQTSAPIREGVDLDIVRVGSYARLDEELFIVQSISDTTITMGRGTLDTVPAKHLKNARIFFVDDYYETDGFEYTDGESAALRLLPVTGLGMLELTSAPVQYATIDARHYKPYPPGYVRINGSSYPEAVSGEIDLSVTWSHRDRLQQTATLVPTTEGSIGPEPGTSYRLVLKNSANSIIHSVSTTETYETITLATLGNSYGEMTLELWSERDGVRSHQTHEIKFIRSGYGTAYGEAYGGV